MNIKNEPESAEELVDKVDGGGRANGTAEVAEAGHSQPRYHCLSDKIQARDSLNGLHLV